MSELSLTNSKKPSLPSFDPVSELINILFIALSNPLYFSYFIFFSPYLYKLFSFLSPLFVTTTLLVLAFITTLSPSQAESGSPLAATYKAILERLIRSKDDGREGDELRHLEEFEVYKIVFDTSSTSISSFDLEDQEVVKETCSEETQELVLDKRLITQESTVLAVELGDEKSLRLCLEEEKEDQTSTKVGDEEKQLDSCCFTRSESKAKRVGESCFASPEWDFEDKYSIKSSNMDNDDDIDNDIDIGIDSEDYTPKSFGSMRKEKEWRRTLACKLFEERHNGGNGGGGGEGMDLLWETYEAESSKAQSNINNNNKMRRNSTKSSSASSKGNKGLIDYSDEDFDDDYEDEANGQLCCLQALKFSAGKMSLGMGKPNLVKFSKALKGIGWLHSVTRHAKKRYNHRD